MALLWLTLACVFGGGLAAISADLRPYNITSGIMFVTSDKNEDGILTGKEFESVFKTYDYNGDNIIERHEYVCLITSSNVNLVYVSHAIYDKYDMDHDHKLEKHDFDAFFKSMDKDGNGDVSFQEFVQHWTGLLSETENHSLHGKPHTAHTDRYCEQHGHH